MNQIFLGTYITYYLNLLILFDFTRASIGNLLVMLPKAGKYYSLVRNNL